MNFTILKQFENNNGYLSNSSKLSHSEKYQLRLMIRDKIITRVKRGLYRFNGSIETDQEIGVSKIVPSGIFCMYTAWAQYELTTFISSKYHIAIDKSLKINLPAYPPIKLYFWNASTLRLGVSEININGTFLKMFDLERSICDAVKFRSKIGSDLLNEILRNYVKRKDKNLDTLIKYSKELRISNTLIPLIQVLL